MTDTLRTNVRPGLETVGFHPSLEGPSAALPAVVVVASLEEVIEGNHTYQGTLIVDLHTQADDTGPDEARQLAELLGAYLTGSDFPAHLAAAATDWLPVHLGRRSFAEIEAEDRRHIQRIALELVAQF